jgi:hypothetical protein
MGTLGAAAPRGPPNGGRSRDRADASVVAISSPRAEPARYAIGPPTGGGCSRRLRSRRPLLKSSTSAIDSLTMRSAGANGLPHLIRELED